MRLSPKALAVTAAIFLGGSTLLIGAANLLEPSYGADYLRSISSVYPGFEASRTVESVLIGTAYGLFDGASAGLLLAWICNFCLRRFDGRSTWR